MNLNQLDTFRTFTWSGSQGKNRANAPSLAVSAVIMAKQCKTAARKTWVTGKLSMLFNNQVHYLFFLYSFNILNNYQLFNFFGATWLQCTVTPNSNSENSSAPFEVRETFLNWDINVESNVSHSTMLLQHKHRMNV